jgi:holin-like protein
VIGGLVVVLSALAIGEGLVRATGAPVPGSVVGLVLFVALLRAKVIPRGLVQPASDLLVRRMGLFFVPAGVIALTRHGDLLWRSLGPVAVSSVVSFVLVLFVVGRLGSRPS